MKHISFAMNDRYSVLQLKSNEHLYGRPSVGAPPSQPVPHA
jgi:hypothetical protein